MRLAIGIGYGLVRGPLGTDNKRANIDAAKKHGHFDVYEILTSLYKMGFFVWMEALL
jgi:hypothetical protein